VSLSVPHATPRGTGSLEALLFRASRLPVPLGYCARPLKFTVLKLDFLECRVQIRNQIVRVLDADRNSNQRVGDSEAIAG
jgi:hypothetical protein